MKNFDFYLAFCHHIKRIRKENKLTQKEMAHKLGVSVSTLSKIEKGIIPPRLSCAVLFRIQREFGIQPKDLFSSRLLTDSLLPLISNFTSASPS